MKRVAGNLYVHFPFCRRKCSYCALHSRVGVAAEGRRDYVQRLVSAVTQRALTPPGGFRTVYFGGGSPALCELRPLLAALSPRLGADYEFTVELHPLDVTEELLAQLLDGGVNRISMGVQSLDEATLSDMARGYTVADAARAFALVKRFFDNAGIDLIVGYPGDRTAYGERLAAELADWGLVHCSVYSLILEEKSLLAHRLKRETALAAAMPSDDTVMDAIREVSAALASLGLERYEISNYAVPGRECRHNLAVWRGEDYFGLGEGAAGRLGLYRTRDWWGEDPATHVGAEKVEPYADRQERALFRLRTREGIDAAHFQEWQATLDHCVAEKLLRHGDGAVYTLTERGTEVCDAILGDLIG